MDKIEKTIGFVKDLASKFGAEDNEKRKDYVFRKNIGLGKENIDDDGAYYFGFIDPEEGNSGPFRDLSFVVFPDKKDGPWLVVLGIGTQGFNKDTEIASTPGLRRLYKSITSRNGFVKTSFTDIETPLPKEFQAKLTNLSQSLKKYDKFLPSCEIIQDPTSKEGEEKIAAYLAAYASDHCRRWASNKTQRELIEETLSKMRKNKKVDDEKEIISLLKERKYVVLQGAPGTGKTRMAKIIANKMGAKIFFTQFHAETDYSDFIQGIRPDTSKDNLTYREYQGILSRAVEFAKQNPKKDTVLIIDEINRANLSNVLGEAFYLFEYSRNEGKIEMEYSEKLKGELPNNFFVVATMNTADRSLAIVDFALRRRFAWYTLKPKVIDDKNFEVGKKDFQRIADIFERYAEDSELNLQPGQGYFMANNDEEMKKRIKYELMPLIKEYLLEGRLNRAKESFCQYFTERIEEDLFE